ncbi:hypothetical protein [Marinivivus vitaminiproducens]|uniref:hypothetical protein n=1 Tax=Marinivivus vitaminiproducens TaxID=3035935 RepID=UPI0027AA26E5|nr:hypothetical protein P4R82_21350 [Geminicoccaceae bacterium SCSIO 64248]
MTAFTMRREVVEALGRRQVVAVDTIAHVRPEDEGDVIVTGSHGGVSSGEYAGRVRIAAVFFNDAGIGKDQAGTAALPYLETLGIAAGTVSHDSALIGDAQETWSCGVISALNRLARDAGFTPGEPARDAIRRVYGENAR